MCDRWLKSFENFYEDMGNRPSSKHSIDRIDNNGDYSPENCRWGNSDEQNNNQRTNRLVELNGVIKTVAQWARDANLTHSALTGRLNRWDDINKSITTLGVGQIGPEGDFT